MATVRIARNARLATKSAAMDACIARGGISHVLSQARASLKNPSRPYTPQTSARPLFQGDDYRPGSRPNSSYTVAELKQMAQQQTHQKSAPSVPKPTKLPPRPNGMKARPPTTPQPEEVKYVDVTASSSSLKLVHAPILSDDESEDELWEGSTGRTDVLETSGAKFDTEASLTLPSNDELLQSYNGAKRCIQELLGQAESSDLVCGVVRLREMVDNFVGLGSFFQVGSTKHSTDYAATTKLCLNLFDRLSSAVLEKWATIAACVLELVPVLLDLYGALGTDRESMNIQMIKLGKTLFVLSKDSCNDDYFCNVRYIEAILHAIAETSSQASRQQDENLSNDNDNAKFLSPEQHTIPLKMLIYTSGTLKNISSADDKMARLLASNRAIAILSETMLWRAEDAPKNKEVAQFLIQTTGILRNLSISKNTQKQFLEARIASRLCGMVPAFIEHQELMVNISRILSKLTLHELPRAQINQSSTNMESLMALVDHRQNSWLSLVDQQRADMRFQDLLFIRVFFVLGNLCAGNDQNRVLISTDFSGITLLLEVLQFYGSRYSDSRHSTDTNEKEERRRASEAEQSMEVLIKLIRVIANLAINAEVGAKLNENEGLMPLLEILEIAQHAGHEELMLNALSCITNVSYYSNAPTGDTKSRSPPSDGCFIESNCVAITQLLSRILLDRNEEAVVEATRAFGNLSRFKDVLAHMGELKVLDCFVVLLDHSNREVVYTVCGVLMNAALDQSTRQALLSVRPVVNDDTVDVRTLLVGIVECAAGDDLEMTLIASKALYNLMLAKNLSSTSSDGATSFACNTMSLRRTIEEVLSTISHQETKRGSRKEASEPSEDHDNEEGSDAWGNRQELRSVLPQLLKSIDSLI